MEDSLYFRDQAARALRLAQGTTDLTLKISLRRLADEYKTRADELEDEENSLEEFGKRA